MKIERIEAAAYTLPTDAPEADGTLAWNSTTIVVVHAHAGGITGLGWTYGPSACASVVADQLAPVVCGQDVFDIVASWDAMVRSTRNASRPGLVGYSISAVDIALWDLKSRMLQLPLHWLLGAAHEQVPIYGSGGFTSYDDHQLTEQLGRWVADGIPRVKIKIGGDWGREPDRDLARIRLARRVVGADTELYVDANGAYSRKQAVRVGRAATEEHGVSWLEEPVSSDDLDGLRQVRDAVVADVAAGEYGWDLYYFRRMCSAQAVDCLQIDATRCGGISEFQRAAAIAASFGLEVSGHCAPHVHGAVAAATPNLRHLEWFHDHVRIESLLFAGTLDPRGGHLRLSGGEPGLGLLFRESDAEPYRVA